MKKKLMVVLLLVLLSPAFIFADIMQLGVNVGYGLSLDEMTNADEDVNYFDAKNFKFAPELRFNIFFLQLDLVPQLSFGEDYFMADTQATLGLQFKILNAVRIGAGAGISLPFAQNDGTWTMNGYPMEDFGEAMGNARMLYKVNLGIPLSAVEISANWIIPAEGSFNDGGFVPNVKNSTFSLGVLLNLF